MRRREFIALLGGAGVALPLQAAAQQPAKVPRIAFISTTSSPGSPFIEAFARGLGDLGYVEGRNIAIEWRWGYGSAERFPEFAAEVVRLNVDVIVAANSPAGLAAKYATKTIPIVIATMEEPVKQGLAASLANPGSNITGRSVETDPMEAQVVSRAGRPL
jgi:putative ABC transport system substrate-binding protein